MLENEEAQLKSEIVKLKDYDSRVYQQLINNFYVMQAALRYFSVKKGASFTSSKVANNFPVPVTVAGSCLNALEKLDVVEVRTVSSSPDRYLPKKVDLDKLESIENILVENREMQEFK